MENASNTATPTVIACSLPERELALRGEELQCDLFTAAEETRELDDGYAYRFPNSATLTEKLIDFIATERRCCSFFRIELEFEPALGPIWLRLRGPDGVKAFIAGVMGDASRPDGESASRPEQADSR